MMDSGRPNPLHSARSACTCRGDQGEVGRVGEVGHHPFSLLKVEGEQYVWSCDAAGVALKGSPEREPKQGSV